MRTLTKSLTCFLTSMEIKNNVVFSKRRTGLAQIFQANSEPTESRPLGNLNQKRFSKKLKHHTTFFTLRQPTVNPKVEKLLPQSKNTLA